MFTNSSPCRHLLAMLASSVPILLTIAQVQSSVLLIERVIKLGIVVCIVVLLTVGG
jgi:hypothetical protein